MTCKKATYLLSKKEEGRLSWIEKWQLRSHLTICHLCRKFEEQTGWLIIHTKHSDKHADHTLSEEVKKKIAAILTT